VARGSKLADQPELLPIRIPVKLLAMFLIPLLDPDAVLNPVIFELIPGHVVDRGVGQIFEPVQEQERIGGGKLDPTRVAQIP